METKKISFGFSKVSKKPEVISKSTKIKEEVQLIDCLEDQAIKIKNSVENIQEPLVIPVKQTTKNLLDRVKEAKAKQERNVKSEIKNEVIVPDSALSVDELAARELIREAKNRDTITNEPKIQTLPLKEDKFVLEGEEEPSLEDYENVPISDYGMAMLRGMGWKEGMPIGKTHSKTVMPVIPELRPKGLGLGANKMANKSTKAIDKDGKELQLVKGGFAKIVDTKHKGQYCEIQGIDVETSRCIVKAALTNEILSLHEYSIVPVTKEEYAVGSRVLNNAKYEEYKEKSNRIDIERSKSRQRASRDRNKSRSRSCDKHRKTKLSENYSENNDSEAEKKNRKSNTMTKEPLRKKCSGHGSRHSSVSEDDRSENKHRSKYKDSENESHQNYKMQHKRKSRR